MQFARHEAYRANAASQAASVVANVRLPHVSVSVAIAREIEVVAADLLVNLHQICSRTQTKAFDDFEVFVPRCLSCEVSGGSRELSVYVFHVCGKSISLHALLPFVAHHLSMLPSQPERLTWALPMMQIQWQQMMYFRHFELAWQLQI